MADQTYKTVFYHLQQGPSRISAEEIVPHVLNFIQPKKIVDVGCGVGTWLSVFKENGVDEIWGIDGDHVEPGMLLIPRERFRSVDLTGPWQIEDQFDLAISLEVVEHLPKECGETFIDSLTRLGPVILFSAAIPFQGGIGHLNEQWPNYWADFFLKRGYVAIDCIRKKIWENKKVAWWYAQNILLYVRRDYMKSHPSLQKEFENTNLEQLSIVHPRKYLALADRRNAWRRALSRKLPLSFKWGMKKLFWSKT